MSRNREVLQQSLALAAEGRAGAAITKLAAAVKSAGRAKDHVWVAQLAKNLALLCAEQNKLEDAAKYYDIALRASKPDPTLHLAIADLYQQIGKHSMAKRHLKTCHAFGDPSQRQGRPRNSRRSRLHPYRRHKVTASKRRALRMAP